ncbi:CsbD family protein [Sphingomonas sp.]|uniref:CsbD family protein n=1 Tax=Sphingomonas sp. TaxID=28214 RepID=UPI00289F7E6B|nr:CsbD family protein [Sphingomonas sp.]
MNTDTLTGSATNIGGQVKEGLGSALGDTSMQAEGKGEQLSGTAQKTLGEAKDAVRPMIDSARQFVQDRPFAAAALGGVLGLALINTLRGK